MRRRANKIKFESAAKHTSTRLRCGVFFSARRLQTNPSTYPRYRIMRRSGSSIRDLSWGELKPLAPLRLRPSGTICWLERLSLISSAKSGRHQIVNLPSKPVVGYLQFFHWIMADLAALWESEVLSRERAA